MLELRAASPTGDDGRDAAVGAELAALSAGLERAALGERDPAAAQALAFAQLALAELGDGARDGLTGEECLERAREAARFTWPADRAAVDLTVARARLAAGRAGEARALLEGALPALDGTSRPWALVLLAEVDRLRGEPELARARADEAAALLAPDVPFHRAVGTFLHGLRGFLALEQGALDEAARAFERERAAAEELGDPELLRASLVHRAALLLAAYREDALADEVRAALAEEAVRAGDGKARAVLGAVLARMRVDGALARGAGVAQAREGAVRALAEPELGLDDAVALRLALARCRLALDDPDGAERELAAALEDERRLTEGLDARSRILARGAGAALRGEIALARGGDLGPALAELEASLADLVARWSALPRRPGGTGFLNFHERLAVLDALVRAHLAAQPGEAGVRAALERVARAQTASTLARDLGARAPTADELAAGLAPGEGLLVLLPALERSHAFALDAAGALHVELPSSVLLDDARRPYQALLETPPELRPGSGDELARRARALARDVLPPALRARVAGWRALTVVGVEYLGWLALESLPLDDGAPLGLALAVGYAPSLPLLAALRERADAARAEYATDLVLAAAPRPSDAALARFPDLAPLPLERARVEALVPPGVAARVLFGDEAGARALDALAPGAARALHLLCHGASLGDVERPAALLLAGADGDDGIAGAERVERWAVPPLALVTACGAGRGPARLGDDAASRLTGALLRGGAACAVLAPTDVELEASLALAETFLARASEGATPAEALLAARRRLAADPRWSDPFHHALVHAVGLAHRPAFPRAPGATAAAAAESEGRAGGVPVPALLAAGAAALALAGGAVALARRRR